jgi:16S rRNA (cytosine967-C5)-methyltransferase
MHYFQSYYFLEAQDILGKYEYPEPFHLFIKKYFKANKKYGSRDRKIISALLYGFFRIGEQAHLGTTQAMAMGAYLVGELPHEWFKKYVIWGQDMYHVSLEEKLEFLLDQEIEILVNMHNPLSGHVSEIDYLESILVQANVFIRVRKDKKLITQALKLAEISYTELENNAIGFAEGLKLSEVLPIEKDYVIQDLSSQYLCSKIQLQPKDKVWDCCAASGGKSIAMADVQPTIELFVSDIRVPILQNLKDRFAKYGIRNYHVFPHDASQPAQWVNNNMPTNSFDVIVCDVPCTGSGTWARTPEQFYFQSELDVSMYADRQLQILQHVWPFVKKGGSIYYMTCSVFAAENEDVISLFVTQQPNAIVDFQEIKLGAEYKADSMFICKIIKNE